MDLTGKNAKLAEDLRIASIGNPVWIEPKSVFVTFRPYLHLMVIEGG